jgi:hypothetical protein
MTIAERIVFELIGPGTLAEWHRRLPNRPDWQRAIERVNEMLKELGA